MADTIAADTSRNELLRIAAAGLVSGVLTPLMPVLLDRLVGLPRLLQMGLVALPFAVLVFFVVRRRSANPVWAAVLAGLITMVAFVCAVHAAVAVDAQLVVGTRPINNVLVGLTGGLVGSALMALGIALLPAGPKKAAPWLPMLVTGAVAGSLLALDSWLELDRTSFLYPVWQAAVAARLAVALRP